MSENSNSDESPMEILASVKNEMEECADSDMRALRVERDPERARLSADEAETVTARGHQLPSGAIAVKWRKEAFEEDDRSEDSVVSLYLGGVEDARQATAGNIVFEDAQN